MTKKNFQKQIFSLLLVFTMLMTSILVLPAETKAATTNKVSDSTATLLTNAKTVKYVTEGKTFTLKSNKSVTYSTTNKAVVTVSSSGKITGKKIGESVIKVTQKSNKNNVQYLKLYITSKLAKTYRYKSYDEMWKYNGNQNNNMHQSIYVYPGTRIYIGDEQLVGPKGSNADITAWCIYDGYRCAELQIQNGYNTAYVIKQGQHVLQNSNWSKYFITYIQMATEIKIF